MNKTSLEIREKIETFKEEMFAQYNVEMYVISHEYVKSTLFIKELEKIVLKCLIKTNPEYSQVKSFKQSKSKKTEIAVHKQLFSYIAFYKYNYNKSQIARHLNNDHTSVMHNIQAANDYISTKNEYVMGVYSTINNAIKEHVGNISENITV